MTKYKIVRAVPELCTGCRICEMMCSLAKTNTINPYVARLKVTSSSDNGARSIIMCRHCKPPLCKEACPVEDAMYIDEQTGAVVINENTCTGCLECAEACPFGAIGIGPEKEVLKCDLCKGDPVCVKYCPPRPARQFPHTPFPRTSCLEYVVPQKNNKKHQKIVKHPETNYGDDS
jgi:carbon-monoxide dehydrogenase iron sulfur subunit